MIGIKDEIIKEAVKCVKCGACLSVCPVYKELCEESNSPRGRAALAEEISDEHLDFTVRLVDIFSKCIACEACEEVCPKSVPVTKIIYEMREMLYEQKHYDKTLHAVIKLMYNSPYLFTLLLKNAALLKPLLFEELGDANLLKPRINLPLLNKTRAIPKIGGKFFLDNDFGAAPKSADHISMFTGCVFNYIYQGVASDSLRILKSLEKEVHVCTRQICCGFPALAIGDYHGLKKTILENMEILDETRPNAIVVLCSSCSLMLRKYYPMVVENESGQVKDKVRRVSSKIVDLTTYLKEHGASLKKNLNIEKKVTVTYHQPCHLSKGLESAGIIKEILGGIGNVEVVDPENPAACCGYGGIFNYKYPELSSKIIERKIRDILATKADIVLTSCSGCIMQLKEGLLRFESDVEAMHICEFIARYI